ncbi:MAG TPA: hypothetical protein VL693_14195 [Vicinamibacterales bacterium]|nr:hypothetical protein [Vicinamibacterales bacterium]
MTLREKLLYQQLHPMTLGADASALLIAAVLLWQQHLLRALVVATALPLGASIVVLSSTAEETWARLRSGRHERVAVTAAIVCIRIAAMFLFWTAAWYRSVTLCAAALGAGALTWTDIHPVRQRVDVHARWASGREQVVVGLRAAERHKNTIAFVLVAIALADVAALYVADHPFRSYLIENSDLLYLPALFSDVLSRGGHLSDWHLTPAPYFFPDYLMYFVAYISGSTTYVRIVLFSLVQTIVTLAVLWLLARGLSRPNAFICAATATLVLVWLALTAGEPFVILLASASHFGAFLSSLLLAALWLHHQTSTDVVRRRVLLGTMCVLACAATLSDNLFVVSGTLPFIVTVMATAPGSTVSVIGRGAPRLAVAAAWIVLTLVVPAFIYRTPISPPSVNIAWSPDVDDYRRSTLEQRFHLADADFRGGHLWTYRLQDWSRVNVSALLRDPAVADTQHIDRQSFAVDGVASPLQRALTAVPVGAVLATFAVIGSLYAARARDAVRRRQPLTMLLLPLAPAIFSLLGSMSYGFVVPNPTRYPLSLGLEKMYGNLTDLFGSVSRAVVNHPTYGAIAAASVGTIIWILSRRATTPDGGRVFDATRSLAIFGAASVCFTITAISFMTDLPVMARYLIPVFCWPIVTLPMVLPRALGRGFAVAATAVCVVAALSLTSRASALVSSNGVRPRYYSGELACIDNALRNSGMTNGIAQYWDAKYLQQFSRLNLNIAQYLENLEEMRWITSKRYFKDRYDFAVVDESAEPTYKISIDALTRVNGPPRATVSCGSRTLYVYGKDKLRTTAGAVNGRTF